MKLNTTPRVGTNDPVLQRELREHASQVNLISEGRIAGRYNALTSVPVGIPAVQGDFIANQSPTELGTAGSKYVIEGWMCVVPGESPTWVQKRFLTGN